MVVCGSATGPSRVGETTGAAPVHRVDRRQRRIHASHPSAGIADAVNLAVGPDHSCVVTKDGRLRCWGNNDDGRLGVGPIGDQLTPVEVSGPSHACWGRNEAGQLGRPTTEKCRSSGTSSATTPVLVMGQTP